MPSVRTRTFAMPCQGADFVILSFSKRNAHYRGVDVQKNQRPSRHPHVLGGHNRPRRRLLSAPGANLMRSTASCGRSKRLCPEAWLVNYINPSAVFGMAPAKRFAAPLGSPVR